MACTCLRALHRDETYAHTKFVGFYRSKGAGLTKGWPSQTCHGTASRPAGGEQLLGWNIYTTRNDMQPSRGGGRIQNIGQVLMSRSSYIHAEGPSPRVAARLVGPASSKPDRDQKPAGRCVRRERNRHQPHKASWGHRTLATEAVERGVRSHMLYMTVVCPRTTVAARSYRLPVKREVGSSLEEALH